MSENKKPEAKTSPLRAAATAATKSVAKEPVDNKKLGAASVNKVSGEALDKMRKLLKDEGAVAALVSDEAEFLRRRKMLVRLIGYQNWAIIVLISVLILGVPVFMPSYNYYLRTPEREVKRIIALDAPNITNEVLLSWARTSVIEILTVGFGNFDEQLSNQSDRFTEEGWKNFVRAIARDDLISLFSKRQWVLTTVPSDDPVVVSQGPNKDGVYEWVVEIPVAMTFTTNNNVTKGERNTISLTIIRVPTKEKERGIAIKSWKMI